MKKIVCLTLVFAMMCSMISIFSLASFSAAKDDSAYDCVAYAKARFREIWGFDLHATGSDGANGYYFNASVYGDTVSNTPRVGALAVWDSAVNDWGHVAIVESVSGSNVTYSEGGYIPYQGASKTFNQETRNVSSMSKTNQPFLGYVYVKGTYNDTEKPTISNVYLSNMSGSSFTVNCTLSDDSGVTRVWLNIYGPNGNDGYSVDASSGNFSHTISTSKYGGAGTYSVHIYAFDAAGNETGYSLNNINAIDDVEKPVISNVYTSEISSDSFTINCTLDDNVGVSRVWLNIYGPNGNDGYAIHTSSGNFSHTISTSKYGGAGTYSVHIYAFDTAGNETGYKLNNINVVDDKEKPIISNAYASKISSSSFTINCNLDDNVGVTRVWLNIYGPSGNDGYSVNATSGDFSHTISTSKYGGSGVFSVHIYAFDYAGNEVGYALNNINVYDYYSITYNNSGGNSPESQTKKHNENITLSSTIPTKDGYTFLGWSTDENSTVPEYFPGDIYSENKGLTLYAVWEEIKVETGCISGLVQTSGNDSDKIIFEFIDVDNEDNIYTTEIDGDTSSYDLDSLASGNYIMKISKNNHVTREYEVTIGENNVNLDIQLNLIGDINGDGKITLLDYTQVLRHVKKTSTLDGYEYNCADVNGDGKLMVTDYARILKHVKKTETLW